MKGRSASVTSKGQVTVPVEVRDYLGIRAGDRLLFVRDAERVYIEKVPGKVSSREVFGILHRPDQSFIDLDKARLEVRASRVRRADPKPCDNVPPLREDNA